MQDVGLCTQTVLAAALQDMGSVARNADPLADLGKERVDGAERPSTLEQVWSIRLPAASIPQSVNEVSVDPLRGTTPPPWSRIATLTRLPHRTSRALPPARGQQRPQGALQAEF